MKTDHGFGNTAKGTIGDWIRILSHAEYKTIRSSYMVPESLSVIQLLILSLFPVTITGYHRLENLQNKYNCKIQ